MQRSKLQTFLVSIGAVLSFLASYDAFMGGCDEFGFLMAALSIVLFSAGNTLRISKELSEIKDKLNKQ